MGFRSKLRGYSAAFRVERFRAAAESLRKDDPETYQQILDTAEGEAAEAARNDPDAFVALFLSFAEEAGVFAPEQETDSEPQAWPEAPPEGAPLCSGSERKPHAPVTTLPVDDPFEPTYRCPTCGREQRLS